MTLLAVSAVVLLAGAAGGLVNALVTDNGFVRPRYELADGRRILRPGYLGNVLFGAVGALVSWGLYGPFGQHALLGSEAQMKPEFYLTPAMLVGALLVGVAGARYVTAEADKKLLSAAASEAAAAQPAGAEARRIALATPAQALDIARSMPVPARERVVGRG